MNKEVVFLQTRGAMRGGLLVGIEVQSKEAFLQAVEQRNENIKDKPYYGHPDYRFAYVDGGVSKKFKNMTIAEFEDVFTEEDKKRLGSLLEYGTGKYSDNWKVFLKAVYLKHGYLKEDTE